MQVIMLYHSPAVTCSYLGLHVHVCIIYCRLHHTAHPPIWPWYMGTRLSSYIWVVCVPLGIGLRAMERPAIYDRHSQVGKDRKRQTPDIPLLPLTRITCISLGAESERCPAVRRAALSGTELLRAGGDRWARRDRVYRSTTIPLLVLLRGRSTFNQPHTESEIK